MSFLKIRRKGEKDIEEAMPAFAPLPKETLGITPEASARILALAPENPCLRVAIKGGGCSGLSLHFDLSQTPRPDDHIFEQNGARVCIDKKSLGILGGATLHTRKNLSSVEFFLVNNPVAKQCSCGQSFSL